MSFLPSASKLDLASACSFAWAPHAGRWPKQEMSPAAAFGSAVHKVAELYAVSPVTVDLRAIADEYALSEADYAKFLVCSEHVREWLL